MPAKEQKPSSGANHQPPNSDGGSGRSAKRLLYRQKRFLNRRYDEGGVPRDDLWRTGVKHLRRMRVDTAAITAPPVGGGPAPAVAGGVRWKQIGPHPLEIINDKQFQGAGPDSGEVVDIAVDPRGATDQVIYVATNDGGIWKTLDRGLHSNSMPHTVSRYLPSSESATKAEECAWVSSVVPLSYNTS